MYKSKLQELCHQRVWSLPHYSWSKDGPDHHPRFKASVLVHGIFFTSTDSCKSSKQAQDQAAMMAFQHFTSQSTSPPAGSSSVRDVLSNNSGSGEPPFGKNEETPKDDTIHGNASGLKENKELRDVPFVYKSQLQIYAQKRHLDSPVYSCVGEGLPHAFRFKALVKVDGQCFESPRFFRTTREAEHAAAKVALSSLSEDGNQEDDCGLYKNLLQELARKERLSPPVYTTTSFGESHVPTFISTVHVEGKIFHGVNAKTKKQAEINAAKIAYFSLRERQLSSLAPLSENADPEEAFKPMISSSQPAIATALQQKPNLEDGTGQEAEAAEDITDRVKGPTDHSTSSSLKSGNDFEPGNIETSSPDIISVSLQVPAPCRPLSSQDGSSSPTTVLECYGGEVTNPNEDLPEAPYTLLCNRVRVYPCKPNLEFSSDVTVLPISDDKWVAVRLDYPS